MLKEVVDVLACPVCRAGFSASDAGLVCENGHSFDAARQGYVSLFQPRGHLGAVETADMVSARETFLGTGHFAPILGELSKVAQAVVQPGEVIVDVGAGPGYYLAGMLEATEDSFGIALDISKYAARRAARAHPRAASIVADVWAGLPIRDGSVALVTDVFAPRNPPEFARVLRPGGAVAVVTPNPAHLQEIAGPLSLLAIDRNKSEMLSDLMQLHFHTESRLRLEWQDVLSPDEAATVALMGPAAWHVDRGEVERLARALGEGIEVTFSVDVSVFRQGDVRG